MDRMINYIKLTGMLRTYKTYNSTIEFSKYEFNNKCMYVCICEYIYIYIYRERERERESWVQVTPGITLNNVTPLNIFKLNEF